MQKEELTPEDFEHIEDYLDYLQCMERNKEDEIHIIPFEPSNEYCACQSVKGAMYCHYCEPDNNEENQFIFSPCHDSNYDICEHCYIPD